MTRTSFNAGWTVKPKVASFIDIVGGRNAGTEVTLPHDAMISFHRSATRSEGPSTGYFPGGAVEYAKTLHVPSDWRDKRVSVEFQGVYRDAMVFVNGAYAGQCRNGYTPFRVPLDAYLQYGETNTIRVEARAHQDSRWYSGLGIYRDTLLIVTPLAHIAADGIRVTTPDVDDERAVVEIATTVRRGRQHRPGEGPSGVPARPDAGRLCRRRLGGPPRRRPRRVHPRPGPRRTPRGKGA